MNRQLAALDRWYAEQAAPSTRGGDGRRRFLVATTTVVIALLATGHLLHKQGFVFGIGGIHERRGKGPSTTVPGSDAYRFVAHQPGHPDEPVTYDPCRTIHLVVNDTLAPAGSERIVRKATAAVASATGLRLVVEGRTDEEPTSHRPLRAPLRYGRGWSPVLVAWTTPERDSGLAGGTVGLGGSASVVDEISGRSTYVTGTVTLDTPQLTRILTRPDGAAEVRAVVMHELGHVVGLAHVDDAGELMYKEHLGQTAFGPGDRTGLAALGRGRCAG